MGRQGQQGCNAQARTRRTYKEELLYSAHLIFHPFDGFWDLKHENRGSVRGALTFIGLTIVSFCFKYAGINVFFEIIGVMLPIMLFVTANWCLTTLFEGEGSFKDIFVATGYAVAPLPFMTILSTALANVLTAEESGILTMINNIAYVWVGILLFFGVMITHDYQLGKNILTIIGTIVGMIVICLPRSSVRNTDRQDHQLHFQHNHRAFLQDISTRQKGEKIDEKNQNNQSCSCIAFGAFGICCLLYAADTGTATTGETEAIDYFNHDFATQEDKLATMNLMLELYGYQLYFEPTTGEVAYRNTETGAITFTNPYSVCKERRRRNRRRKEYAALADNTHLYRERQDQYDVFLHRGCRSRSDQCKVCKERYSR